MYRASLLTYNRHMVLARKEFLLFEEIEIWGKTALYHNLASQMIEPEMVGLSF